MAYTLPSLRDREYAKFQSIQPGSVAAVSTYNSSLVKVYEFPIGSISTLDTGGAISGGNFESYTHYPLNGVLQAIEYQFGNFIAGGSIFLKTSGTVETQLWGTITRATDSNFTVFPVGTTVTTTDDSTISGNTVWYQNIPMSGILHLIGSDLGKSKAGAAFKIAYI